MDGLTVAALLAVSAAKIFKTLVTRGASKGIYVFVIPVGAELDLKKAAKAVGEKSIEMVHVSEINALTGYIRGGCSPVGMRKHYTTTYDASALAQDTMIVSAGKIGFQVELGAAGAYPDNSGENGGCYCRVMINAEQYLYKRRKRKQSEKYRR